jgi:hypothetical protein
VFEFPKAINDKNFETIQENESNKQPNSSYLLSNVASLFLGFVHLFASINRVHCCVKIIKEQLNSKYISRQTIIQEPFSVYPEN